jgi:transposase
LPRFYGAPSTVRDRFQEWQKSGFFEKMWQAGLLEYDTKNGLEWEWQAIDGAMTKAPLGGPEPELIQLIVVKPVQKGVF